MVIGDGAERLLFLLWQTSWQGALFAACVAGACALFRVSAAHRAFLWLLVCVKFVAGFAWLLCFGEASALAVTVPWHTTTTPSSLAATAPLFPVPAIAALWIAGSLIGLIWLAVRAALTANAVRRAAPRAERSLRDLLTAIGLRLGLTARRIPTVRETPSPQSSPQVTLWRANPVIVFPRHLLAPSPQALSPEELRFVLAHELAHVRRGDLWIGLLFAVAQMLFFFHPCIYWARHEWEAAREEACDALALQACGTGIPAAPALYGALLLRLGNGRGSSNVPAAGMASSPFAGLRRRLRHLETWQKAQGKNNSSWWRLAVIAPALAGLFVPLRLQSPPASAPSATPAVAVAPTEPLVPTRRTVPRPVQVAIAPVRQRAEKQPRTPRTVTIPTVKVAPQAVVARSAPAPKLAPVASRVAESPVVTVASTPVPVRAAIDTVTEAAEPAPAPTPTVTLAESLPSSAVVVATQPSPAPRLSRALVAATPTVSASLNAPKSTDSIPVSPVSSGSSAAETASARSLPSEPVLPRTARNTTVGETARPSVSFPLPQPSPSPSPTPLTIPAREPFIPELPRR